jgi:membrane-associated phospholipid phosphatase
MKKMLSVYGLAYLGLLLFVLGLQCVYPKLELHLLLNSYHTSLEDTFFKYYTQIAEWPLYILALLPILWKKLELTILFALSELSGGAVLQILKHTFCFERPVSAFEHCQNMALPLVQGVDMHHSNSFPSGHASTFFVFYTCCALYLAFHYKKQNTEQSYGKRVLINVSMLSLLVLAALGAYSRIYLSQHFLSDVCMGSIIGFITPCLIFYFGRKLIMKLKSASLSFFRNFANKSQSYENSSYSSRNALKS